MRSKSILLLTLALGCGLIASIGISQVMDRNKKAAPTGETQAIFIALTDINPSDTLTAENIKLEEWPTGKVPAGALTKLEDVDGKRARTKLFAGEPILIGKLGDETGASKNIPPGYRVVAVKVDAVSSGGSLIQPGDRVDVLVHLQANPQGGIASQTTKTILKDVKVYAVDSIFVGKEHEEEIASAKTISLLVKPQEAEMVQLVSKAGEVQLVLRGPGDTEESTTPGITLAQILGLESKGDRQAELGKPETAQFASVGNTLLDLLKKQSQKQPVETHTSQPPQAVQENWKMVVIRGSEITEVEVPPSGVVNMPTLSTPFIVPPAATDEEKDKEDTGSSETAALSGADEQ
jgi:pilus assembly protein CpaB